MYSNINNVKLIRNGRWEDQIFQDIQHVQSAKHGMSESVYMSYFPKVKKSEYVNDLVNNDRKKMTRRKGKLKASGS